MRSRNSLSPVGCFSRHHSTRTCCKTLEVPPQAEFLFIGWNPAIQHFMAFNKVAPTKTTFFHLIRVNLLFLQLHL